VKHVPALHRAVSLDADTLTYADSIQWPASMAISTVSVHPDSTNSDIAACCLKASRHTYGWCDSHNENIREEGERTH